MQRLLKILGFSALLIFSASASAQQAAVHPELLGTWEGSLVLGRDNMSLAFTFGMNEGDLTAALISSAMGIYGMPAESVTVNGLNVQIRISRLDMEFNGTLRLTEDGKSIVRIDGDYYQQSEMVPVVLLPVASPSF